LLNVLLYRYTEEIENTRPIIAILSQPYSKRPPYTTYIATAYAKFIEQAGARVTVIRSDDTDENIALIMRKVNGVLFAGGDILLQNEDDSLTPFTLKAKFIVEYAKKLNDEGIYFPVMGTCQGFEQISLVEAKVFAKLIDASAQNIPRNLEFQIDPSQTRMYEKMPSDLIEALKTKNIAYHNNEYRFDPVQFEIDPGLQEYNVLAISHDRDDRKVVASIEHKTYPIYANQWHPEKNEFIWIDVLPIPHSKVAIDMGK
jgi:gamma-glutamyl hydrolase